MRFLLVFLFLLPGITAHAQSFILKGRLTDTINNNNLPHASVALIRASDSLLVTYTRANEEGVFALSSDSADRSLLLATFPGFADFVDVFQVNKPITDI